MKRIFLILLNLCWLIPITYASNSYYLSYIDEYATIAVSEMERVGIPASIKLAQAILESNAGRSELASKANNHFGIKCGSSWKGKTMYRKDDDRDRFGRLKKSCFRAYKNVADSYKAHSEFLHNQGKSERYGFLFDLQPDDYKGWAKGLKKAGYATNPKYDKLLIKIIEEYQLYKYDSGRKGMLSKRKNKTENRKENKTTRDNNRKLDSHQNFKFINDIKVVKVRKETNIRSLSSKYDISEARLLVYNPQLNKQDIIQPGVEIFLQPLRSKFRGKQKFHKVKQGENIEDISRKYGVKLSALQKRNKLAKGDQPRVGVKIYLKGKAKEPVSVRKVVEPNPPNKNLLTTTPVKKAVDEKLEIKNTIKEKPVNNYLVKQGDTLYSISKKFELTIEYLKKVNNLSDNQIHPGQLLQLK